MFDEMPKIMKAGICELCGDEPLDLLIIGNTAYDDGHAIGICEHCCDMLWTCHKASKDIP